jgi:hypothetical protein
MVSEAPGRHTRRDLLFTSLALGHVLKLATCNGLLRSTPNNRWALLGSSLLTAHERSTLDAFHFIYITPDGFIQEKPTFPTLVDFKNGIVPHLRSPARTRWRCFSVCDLNQRGNSTADKCVQNAICNSVRPPAGSFDRCPAADPLCRSLCHGRGAQVGQNFLLSRQPM